MYKYTRCPIEFVPLREVGTKILYWLIIEKRTNAMNRVTKSFVCVTLKIKKNNNINNLPNTKRI